MVVIICLGVVALLLAITIWIEADFRRRLEDDLKRWRREEKQ